MKKEPLMIAFNAPYIQAIYDERDQALAKNRELETWFEDACLTVKHLADQLIVADKERDDLLIKIQILEEEKAGLECCYDVERKAHTACMAENNQLRVIIDEALAIGEKK